MAVVIETTLGDITVDLFIEERPRACLNFVKLCKLKYYNFNLFHTIERDFIAQTGDPNGAGDGGESVWGVVEGPHKRFFEAESLPKIKHTVPGLLSLVSVGKFMVGSQFFLTLGSDLTSLDGIHCVIGEVVEGHEVLRKLNEAIVDEKFRPYQDIRVTHTVILDDPFNDPRGFQIPSRSPSPTADRLQNGRIGADEDIDDTEGKTVEEIQEMLAEREAKARATILEIVGDLPDADIAPPENVLFVCKLNPITTDDDLEIIFSRFGKVKSCEVIRDKVTGDSLQYAFVEFEEQKACEAAYFKMDNVLIDDRRIHVDFSQSVSKVQWRGKGRLIHKEENDEKLDFNNLRAKGEFEQPRRPDQRRHRDRSRSPMRRKPDDDRKNRSEDNRPSREYAAPRDRGNASRQYSSNTSRRSPINERRRSPLNGRRRSRSNERRPYQNRNQTYNDRRHFSDRWRSFSPNSNNRGGERRRFYDTNERQVNRDSYRNSRQDTRYNRNYNSREERREQISPSPKVIKDREQSGHHNLDKRLKSKKHDKSKKKHVSSSSSESESDSSSTSTSTSSSSSSKGKRKKSSKSKRKLEKTKTRQKKKSKRRDSSSTE